MKKKSVSKNYIYNILYDVLTLLVPLITAPYVSRILKPEGIGLYSFTYSIAAYFTYFAALGTTVYARREIAYQQDSIHDRSKVFWEILILRGITTGLSIVVYMAYLIFSQYQLIGLIQMFYIISILFDVTWFFQGMEDFGTVVLKNSLVKIANIIFIFVFVKSRSDLIIYIFGLAFIPLIGNILTLSALKKYIKRVTIKELHPFDHFRGAFVLFIPTIASQVYLLLDKTMIGVFTTDNIENGYYEQAQKIIKICWTFITTYAAVMSPRISATLAKKNIEKAQNYMKKSFSFVWFVASPIAFGLTAIAPIMVPWFFGSDYLKVIILLQIFAWIVFPIGLNSVTGNQFLIPTKKHRPYNMSIITGALVNFVLNLILIPRYYSVGAAISSVIAEIVICLYQIIYIVCYTKTFKIRDIFGSSYHYLISSFVMFIVISLLSRHLSSNFLSVAIIIGLGALLYGFGLILLKDELILNIVNKLKYSIINKKKGKVL